MCAFNPISRTEIHYYCIVIYNIGYAAFNSHI